MTENLIVNRSTFAIIKPIETEKTQADFNIFGIKDIFTKDPEEQDKEINKFIDTLIDEFIEFKDIIDTDFYDMLEDYYLKNNEYMKKYFVLKNPKFQNRRIYEDSKYCYRLTYPTLINKQPETSNYLATVLENKNIIYSEVIITKTNLETKRFEHVTKDDVRKIIYQNLLPKGIFINTDYKLCLEVGFYDRNFNNYFIGALGFVGESAIQHDIDITCGTISLAYNTSTNEKKLENYKNIKHDMSLERQIKNENYYNYIYTFLENIIGKEQIDKVKNCIFTYSYSMNGEETPYNTNLNNFCKIIEFEKDYIKRKEFSRMNSTNEIKNNSFYIFKAIENIKLPFEEIKN